MPRLRSLNGSEVIRIIEGFGFSLIRVTGSHHIMQRIVEGRKQVISVPVHGHKSVATGTLRKIYREALRLISEDALRPHFYSD